MLSTLSLLTVTPSTCFSEVHCEEQLHRARPQPCFPWLSACQGDRKSQEVPKVLIDKLIWCQWIEKARWKALDRILWGLPNRLHWAGNAVTNRTVSLLALCVTHRVPSLGAQV